MRFIVILGVIVSVCVIVSMSVIVRRECYSYVRVLLSGMRVIARCEGSCWCECYC